MKRRPLLLTLLALLTIGISVSLPLQVMLRFGIPITEPAAIADKLAPLNWFIMVLGATLACLLFRAASTARIVAPVFLLVLGWNNWLVANLDPELDPDLAIGGTVIVFACMGILLIPSIRELMLHPGTRWWLTPPRKKIALPAKLTLMDGFGELTASTYDLSEGGVFISLDQASWSENTGFEAARAFEIGTRCSVKLKLDKEHTLRAMARVVRHSQAQGQYPAGFAVYFEDLPGANLDKLKDTVRTL